MSAFVDDCAHHCLLPDGQSTLYDELAPFDEDIAGDVTAEEITLSPTPAEVLDETQNGSGSSLPATPAERPCTFCPSALPLPPATCPNRATLVLDLDGTLIASEELNAANSTYLWSPHGGARAPDYEAMGRRVWLRPGVKEFLMAVRPHFEIVLFTAATQNWAAAAIEQLDPAAELFDVMLHRDHTTSDLMWDYVKDLSRLGRDLARVVIVDDNPLMFMYQPDNALHVGAYEASTAGGPDNVLERVAELLIGQVAPAEDVREILGPMASTKSCIVSTVSASNVMDAQTDVAKVHAASISVLAPASGAGFDGTAHAEATQMDGTAGTVAAAAEAGDAAMACDQLGGASDGAAMELEGEGCGESAVLEAQLHQHGRHHQQDDEQHLQEEGQLANAGGDGHCGSGCGAHSASVPAEEVHDWDSESEGAETFDANGAAAQLGADVGAPSRGHSAWGYGSSSHAAALAAPDERQADAGVGAEAREVEVREPEESDAAAPSEQLEEQSEHSSEDFEALMEDAIAEYDSDAYDDRYDTEMGFEGACPANAAGVAAAATAPAAYGGFSRLSSRSWCENSSGDVPHACGLEPFACKLSFAGNGDMSAPHVQECKDVDVHGTTEEVSLGAAAAASTFGAAGQVACGLSVDASACAPRPAFLTSAASGLSGPNCQALSSNADAAGVAKEIHGACLEAPDPQARQPSLPTGMVFLTDLNPAFGSGCPSLEANQPVGADSAAATHPLQATALPSADSCALPRPGLKRAREDAGGDAAAEACVAAGTAGEPSYGGQQPCCRPRLGALDEQCLATAGAPYGGVPEGTNALIERTV